MRTRVLSVVLAAAVTVVSGVFTSRVVAAPEDYYTTTHFGVGNVPPGCEDDTWENSDAFECHHMRTDMNGLDSPQIDVLVAVPGSPTAERDLRIMRQAIEMWEGGITYLAPQMGLDWLSSGVDFHISAHILDPVAGGGGEFSTYPVADPEIVVLATNPVGAVGIGVDPVDTYVGAANKITEIVTGTNPGLPTDEPCHGLSNPLDFEYWDGLPGFDSHHDERSGTYTEDCEGKGGNICFAVNTGLDPAPDVVEIDAFFDLVAHEFGHCLSVGHVGDGAEGSWGGLPPNDIMAYDNAPVGLTKCVSSLNLEGLATRMSRYLDANGDGAVGADDRLFANEAEGNGGDPFQVQHPRDHVYASSTGAPRDCPQPDIGITPGPRTDWTPEAVNETDPVLTVASPTDGASSPDGTFTVAGTVEHVSAIEGPTESSGSITDATGDAKSSATDLTKLAVSVNETDVEATLSVAAIPPTGKTLTSAIAYSVTIDERKFDSFARYPFDTNPMTWDAGAGGYMPAGTSDWDLAANTVTFKIPRAYLADAGITAPYFVASNSSHGFAATGVADDYAPNKAAPPIGVAAPNASVAPLPRVELTPARHVETVTFEHTDENGTNTFHTEQSTFGEADAVNDTAHTFELDVPTTSDVSFTLDWTDNVGGTDLDVAVTGAADSGAAGATTNKPESFTLSAVRGGLFVRVEPYFVSDPADGTVYTLTAHITSTVDPVDTDGDGVFDADDECPSLAGNGENGCPILANEQVRVYLDDETTPLAAQDVDTVEEADDFAIAVTVPAGDHTLRVEWFSFGEVIATDSVAVTHGAGVAQADGDSGGHADGKAVAHGTDPRDPASFPGKTNTGKSP